MPTTTAGQAIGGNIANLSSLYGLAGDVNAFQQGQAPLGLETNLPGYKGLLGTSSENTQQLLQGKIPQDVLNQLAQGAAERGIAMGSPGSPNANAAYLAALGKTSLGLQQEGLQNFQTLVGMTPQVAPFDISKMFVSPEQQQQAAAANAIYAAAPNPAAAAGAGLGAAAAGLGAGGAVGARTPAITAPTPSQSFWPTWTTGATGERGLTIGGQTYYGGSTPTSVADAWAESMGKLGYGSRASDYYTGPQTRPGAASLYSSGVQPPGAASSFGGGGVSYFGPSYGTDPNYVTGAYGGDVSQGFVTGDPMTDYLLGYGGEDMFGDVGGG